MTALVKVVRWIATWITDRLGARRPLLLLLLLAIVGGVTLGLAAHLRDFDHRLALPVAAIGVAVNLVLAHKAERAWSAVLLAALVGFLSVLVSAGRLLDELLALFPSTFGLARDVVRLVWQLLGAQGEPPAVASDLVSSWDSFALALAALTEGAGVVLGRVFGWALALLRGEQARDPVAAAFFWASALWVVVTWVVWLVVRRDQVLVGVAPAGALLVTTLYFVQGEPLGVLAVLSGVLLMMALVAYDGRVRRLEAANRDLAYGVANDTAMVSIFLSLALVTAAAVTPSISIHDIFALMRDLTAGQVGEGGGDGGGDSVARPWRPVTTFDEMRAGGLPRAHLLTTPPEELSKLVVMTISTGELGPMPEFEVVDVEVPRHYWRSVTYDTYAQRGWFTSGTRTAAYAGGVVSGPESLDTQRVLRQEVIFVSDLGGIVHVDGTLLAVDTDYSVAWRDVDDAFGATVDARAYVADSLVVEPSAVGLRAAGTDYPDGIRSRYLDLPDTATARTLLLAQDLTATEPTPYDRAEVIETYLRTTFTYTLDVDLPPVGQDIVDYFLFDLQKGYCDYYASSMVVLARASGLPARMAIGYAPGFYDPEDAYYLVTEADAHAWAEVYFPGYGWVRFEPTAGRPAIDRVEDEEPFDWPVPQDDLLGPSEGAAPPVWERLGSRWWVALLGGGLGVPVISAVLWLAVDHWRLERMAPAAAVTAVYERVRRLGRRLGAPVQTGATPYEYSAAFAGMLRNLGRGRRWQERATAAGKQLHRLTDTYVRVSYSATEPDRIDWATARKAWQGLRWPLWLARLRRGRVRRK
jgi:hypothetical protein